MKFKAFIPLHREVMRTDGACSYCRYPMVAYDAVYIARIQGVSIGIETCSLRCGERSSRVAMEVRYS